MNGCYQLISHSSDGRIEVTTRGEEVLRSIKHKMVIIAITGPYRSGKSFMMNSILGINSSGFGVGNDVRACTQGIWMHIQSLEGKVYVFLDVEGFGSTARSSKDDAKLFALALLTSSLVIYNSMGVINESKVNSLALALSYCEIITAQLQGITTWPTLVWVLRDFMLELADSEGNPISSNQYLEKVLREENKGKNSESFGKMRESILQTFASRQCITLPRPVNEEEDLQSLDAVPGDKLRREFTKGVKKVKKAMMEAEYKSYQGKFLRGKDLAELLKRFVTSINSEEIPDIPSTWEDIVQKEYQRITELQLDEATKAKNLFQTKMPVEEDEIVGCFRTLKARFDDLAIDCYFRNEKFTYDSIHIVTRYIEETVEELLMNNQRACLEFNISLLNSLFSPLFFAIENNEYKDNLDLLEVDWSNIMEQYENRSRGSVKFVAIAEFSKRNQKSELAKLLNDIFSEMKSQLDLLRNQDMNMDTHTSHPFKKTNEQLKTEIAYNRYKMQQFNQNVKIIQKKVLRKL